MSDVAVKLARRADHPFSLAQTLYGKAVVHFERGEFDRAREAAEEVTVLADRLEFPAPLAWGSSVCAWVRVESGEGEAGIAEMQQALDQLAEIRAGLLTPQLLVRLAAGFQKLGRYDDGLGVLERGLAVAEAQGQHFMDAELHRLRAEIVVGIDGNAVEEAEACFGRALETARRQQAKTYELRAATSLARLQQRQGKKVEARIWMKKALEEVKLQSDEKRKSGSGRTPNRDDARESV